MLFEACAAAISDGALSCVVVDPASGERLAEAGHERVDPAPLVENLTGRVAFANPFTPTSRRTDPTQVEELFLLTPLRAVFAAMTPTSRRLVVLAAPPAMSVALGWSLMRRVAAAADRTPDGDA
jgi:hypothetical protein